MTCDLEPMRRRVLRTLAIGLLVALGLSATAFPAMSAEVSTSEFLTRCEAAPEPCKQKVLAYVKFLAEGERLDPSIMQLPASEVAQNHIRWMRKHAACSE